MRGSCFDWRRWLCGILILGIPLCGAAYAEVLAVRVPVANIRSGPNADSGLLWRVEQYHPLKIIEKNGDWYRFRDFEGDEGWIHNSLLEKLPTVITTGENCNVRSGPGTDNDIVFTVDSGIPFKVLKRSDKWIQIQHVDGDSGWIYSSLVWP